jgi:hypothetical protein
MGALSEWCASILYTQFASDPKFENLDCYFAPGKTAVAAAPEVVLIAPFPIDDISERLAIEIGAQIGTEDIYGTMPILVSGARDMRRDQHPWIGPEPRHGCVLEFTDIDIERSASYVIAAKRVDEGFLVDDLAPRDVDEHAPRLHRGKAVYVKETGRLRRPLAADHNKIAFRQEPIEILRAAELAEPRRQGQAWLRVAAGTKDPHTERGAESTDIAPDSAGAHDACSLAFQ